MAIAAESSGKTRLSPVRPAKGESQEPGQSMVVLFKPTQDCNMSCGHCYVGDKRSSDRTTEPALAVEALRKIPPSSEIIFHGGEPTLMGPAFYEGLTDALGTGYRYAMQSNFLRLGPEWLPFIKERLNGRISTSFDIGHAIRNIDSATWLRAVRMLKKDHIRPYVVSILSRANQSQPSRIYDFFRREGLSFRLNPILNLGMAKKIFTALRHDPGAYGEALAAIFDRWFMDPKATIVVDPCCEILSFFILGTSASKCPFTSSCASHIICIEPDFEVLPCAGFDDLGNFSYGNLLASSFEEIMDSPYRFQAEKRASHLPRQCLACPHYPLCKGGCRLETLSSTGNLYGKTTLCRDYRDLFAHIEKRLSREKGDLEDWLLGLYHRSGI
jgi:uncharacterized protein